jgi:hypothetical protein
MAVTLTCKLDSYYLTTKTSMNPKIYKLIGPMIGITLICSCGHPNDFLQTVKKHTTTRSVRLPKSDPSNPLSYLVLFKSANRLPKLTFYNFTSKAKFFSNQLVRQFGAPGVLQINFLTTINLGKVEPGFLDRLPFAFEAQKKPLLSEDNLGMAAEVNFANENAAKNAFEHWIKSGLVWFAEPNRASTLQTETFSDYSQQYSSFASSSWQQEIKLLEAFEYLATQNFNVGSPIIAVMDSGTSINHELLSERIWVNDRVGELGCGNDLNGCNTTAGKFEVLGDGDIGPYNLPDSGVCALQDNGSGCAGECCHGTHVAGIVSAYKAGENLSYAGVCPMCQIMTVKVVGRTPGAKEGTVSDAAIIRGLKYVSLFLEPSGGFAVRVINASFGKFARSQLTSLLIRQLRESANGILVIGAAGNEDTQRLAFPAAYADALAVANIDTGRSNQKAESSNFGRWVDISAPGMNITSTIPDPSNIGSEPKNGTSMAAPVVSGVAGLLLAVEPDLSYSQLRERLLLTADPSIYTTVEYNKNYFPQFSGDPAPVPLLGTGMINANAAVQNIKTSDLPLTQALDRVTSGCAVLRGGAHPGRTVSVFLLLMWPVLCGVFYKSSSKRVFVERF